MRDPISTPNCIVMVLLALALITPALAQGSPRTAKLQDGTEIIVPDISEGWYAPFGRDELKVHTNLCPNPVHTPKCGFVFGWYEYRIPNGSDIESIWSKRGPLVIVLGVHDSEEPVLLHWTEDGKEWYGVLFRKEGGAVASKGSEKELKVEIKPVVKDHAYPVGARACIEYKGKRIAGRFFKIEQKSTPQVP